MIVELADKRGPAQRRGEPLDSRELARRVRLHCLRMTARGGSSHIGSALSTVDILSVLYSSILRIDPGNPRHPDRDRFVLSKGHAGAAVYATLAECGFFDRRLLRQHYRNGSALSGHVSHKGIPGVEVSTGSLGHGLGLATGFALSARMAGRPSRAVALLSDGELDEGSTWEAALFAAHHRLGNLLAVVDYNKLQSLTTCEKTLGLEPLADKWRSFGWRVRDADGHDHAALGHALAWDDDGPEKPTVVLAHTVKGKGVSFMENQVLWHYRTARGSEYVAALRELRRARPLEAPGDHR